MATKKKEKKASLKPRGKAAPKRPKEPVTDPDKPGRFINDSRGPSAPILGHFVDVTEGEFKGRYGTFWTVSGDEKWAVIRTRDDETDLINVEVKNLKRAHAGRR